MNDKTEQSLADALRCTAAGGRAEFTVHTPTGPVHSCVKHARQIEGLMRMLGAHTHAVKAPDGVECANCINEAKAKGKTP